MEPRGWATAAQVSDSQFSNEFQKYHVSLQNSGIHFCSGALLAPFYVATAALCVFGQNSRAVRKGPILVVGGIDDLECDACTSTRITSTVSQIYLPMDNLEYSNYTKAGDIAILKLSKAMDSAVNPNIDYLELPSKSKNIANKTLVVTGYSTKDSGLWYTNITAILNKTECFHYSRRIDTNNIFCAKRVSYNKKDNRICCGDFGSPLVHSTKIKNTLVGITHNSPPVCDMNVAPCSYTNVTSFLPFIKAVINGKPKTKAITFIDV